MRIFLRSAAPILLFSLCVCSPARAKRHPRPHPTPLPTTAATGPWDAEIVGGRQIVVRAPGVKQRRAMSADEHEGLAELALSPDRRWATALATYPYDVVGAEKIDTYRILVHLGTGARVDLQDFPRHFGVETCTVRDFEWDRAKTATLKVTCADATSRVVDLPDAGVPPIPEESN